MAPKDFSKGADVDLVAVVTGCLCPVSCHRQYEQCQGNGNQNHGVERTGQDADPYGHGAQLGKGDGDTGGANEWEHGENPFLFAFDKVKHPGTAPRAQEWVTIGPMQAWRQLLVAGGQRDWQGWGYGVGLWRAFANLKTAASLSNINNKEISVRHPTFADYLFRSIGSIV